MDPFQAPTVDELMTDGVVLTALDQAWFDSTPEDPFGRHEEGGWIYFDPSTYSIDVRRASRGNAADLELTNPPVIPGHFLVATYHTHPNPSSEGWDPRPSDSDENSAILLGVPCIIRADDGDYKAGPESRRGGLAGPPGFPD